ncbi:MAG TPA: hypothetical protein GX521_01600, partial [Firmicutes bacterium]|nr:hypothetical protein [Bacillota bacterium]
MWLKSNNPTFERTRRCSSIEMPVQYAGLIEEHLLVRSKVGLFDLS